MGYFLGEKQARATTSGHFQYQGIDRIFTHSTDLLIGLVGSKLIDSAYIDSYHFGAPTALHFLKLDLHAAS